MLSQPMSKVTTRNKRINCQQHSLVFVCVLVINIYGFEKWVMPKDLFFQFFIKALKSGSRLRRRPLHR
jgi:hypothetical protein